MHDLTILYQQRDTNPEPFWTAVSSYVHRYARKCGYPEDVAQDALLNAYRYIDSFDGRHTKSWLCKLVKRSMWLYRTEQSLMPTDELLEEHATTEIHDVALDYYGSSFSPRESRIIDLLSKRYTYREVADELGTTEAAIKSILQRIRQRLGK